jgi:hypothetical protein
MGQATDAMRAGREMEEDAKTRRGHEIMRATTTAIVLLLLLGSLSASRSARSQEPPPFQGNDAPPAGDAAPQDDAPQAEAASDPAVASVEYFHEQLSPYGQWVVREGYGSVWVPQVRAGWRPYTTGHWLYTDQGWAWVADEPWGWAAFHYGRWYYDPELGWAWVPGTVWAPAWVAWRHGGGYLGWAPLPPAVGFTFEAGLAFGAFVITPGFYTFVGERDILATRVSTVIVSSTRNVTIVTNTTNITNYGVVNGRIVNSGVSADRIAQVTGRPVPRVAVASLARASANGKGAFYQPPVVTRAAKVAHAEFGKALPTQIATQQKSRVLASSATGARPATTAGRSRTATSGAGSRTPTAPAGQKSTRTTGAAADESSHGKGHYGVGIDNTSHGTSPNQPHGSQPAGQSGPQGHAAQGAAQPPAQQAPPKKAAPPPPKDKEKEKKPPPPPPPV